MQTIWQQLIDYTKKYLDYKLLVMGGLMILIVFQFCHSKTSQAFEDKGVPLNSEAVSQTATAVKQSELTQSSNQIHIDVKGAIKRPGVYTFKTGVLVHAAIQKAGGLTSKADTQQVNLAQKLNDGQMIYIPAQGEKLPKQNSSMSTTDKQADSAAKYCLNDVTLEELQTLPGFGEKTILKLKDYFE
ncbi:SLBB domain-containing protein [Weissella minor]|uniref:SLBB domain-containing protein n=1 Tax=Weissella minor TaxID=1620 RepID=UPI001BAEF569|nr:SLBB domain-containing protein [Weissella minor]MBS0950419.1 SLBB domain-containing protein [Weissella minor]